MDRPVRRGRELRAGADDARVNDVEWRFDFAGIRDEVFTMVTGKLETCRTERALPRLLFAPERVGTLMRDHDDWLPMGKTRG